jgi:peroxiredoxin
MIRADGSFIAEMVEPGTYTLSGNMRQKDRDLLLDTLNFEVPAATTAAADSTVDAGVTTLRTVVYLKPGDTAPELAAPSLDGTTLKLSDYKGKFVLLDFWATWCGPCVAEIPNLQATYEAFGKDRRFVMISLSSDSEPDAPRKFARAKGIAWAQAFLGSDWSNPVAKNYGISAIPQIMLIGPDGKMLARDLRGSKIRDAVARALGP